MDTESVISVEGLGKRYLIQHQVGPARYRRFSEELAAALARPFRRREDGGASVAKREWFWALRAIGFDVRRGEVVGIIGRNGAGKSTLLKVLSRITEPTEGRVRIRGRVASLLEVGTGFHPELTGRENIFLNGTILGMTRREIQSKFDEIVAFAEIEKFLDTPVKRYSSGMYVRLAFAVAAHLEPEILIVDEVLAVGDIQFQRKCLGKMRDVAGQGRTVLFVSHNMAAVKALTTSAMVLEGGKVIFEGSPEEAVERHATMTETAVPSKERNWGRGQHTEIRECRILNRSGQPTARYMIDDELHVEVLVETDGSPGLSLEVFLRDGSQSRLGMMSLHQFHGANLPKEPGVYRYVINLGRLELASGPYSFDAATSVVNVGWDHVVQAATEFEVTYSGIDGSAWDFKQSFGFGSIALRCREVPAAVRVGRVA